MTWKPPKKHYIRCVLAFHEAFPRSPVLQGPSHLLPLTGQLQCQSTLVMGGYLPTATTSPKTEIKKRRKHKSAKCTVTSETVSPPEKKKKVISESPDSQAEGPFYDTDTLSAPDDSPHALLWWLSPSSLLFSLDVHLWCNTDSKLLVSFLSTFFLLYM